MNDIDPQAWLADVLTRIAEHPVHRLDELMPYAASPLMPCALADAADWEFIDEVSVGIIRSCAQAVEWPVSLLACESIDAPLSCNGRSDHVVTKQIIHGDGAGGVAYITSGQFPED